MVVGDWRSITDQVSPDMPVIFYRAEAGAPPEEGYHEGKRVELSRQWSPQEGWTPCVVVVIGNTL